MKPTRTINKLHFEDLNFSRFEDLSLAMVYRICRWADINHYGRLGKDDGIDIHATEELENGAVRSWFIQCKRYQRISKSELRDVVDRAINRCSALPDILLLIVSCDVSKGSIDLFKQYASKKGIKQSLIWAASIIETKLYAEYHDLLFAYFGISLSSQRKDRITTIRRGLKMKERMRKDFVLKSFDPNESLCRPYKKFQASEVIIRSIDDTSYPDVDSNIVGISPWFKVELYNFYHNGIEVIIGIQEAIFNEMQEWDIQYYGKPDRKGNYTKARVFVIGRIPYENINEYDLTGDEFYNSPHIYCDFKNNGMPYEEILYSIISKESKDKFTRDVRLDNNKRKNLV